MQRVECAEFAGFEWDEAKRQANLLKAAIDFYDAAAALLEPHLEAVSNRGDEPRTKAITMASGRINVVIFTMRGDNCRIISSWPADKNEQREYRQVFGG